MQNTLETIKIKALLIALAMAFSPIAYAANERSCAEAEDMTSPDINKIEQTSRICLSGKILILRYNYRKRELSIHRQGSAAVTLQKISRSFDPELILGGNNLMRFLPMRLQPYLAQRKVLYLSSLRTTGGDGSGQCGSGLEIFLNVLDVSTDRPKKISSLLISSCAENVFLDDGGTTTSDFFDAFVNDAGRLKLKFLAYKVPPEDDLVAALSCDFRSLQFNDGIEKCTQPLD